MQKSSDIPIEVTELVEKRTEAKKTSNFALSDEIRNRVTELGYQIKDTAKGQQVTKI